MWSIERISNISLEKQEKNKNRKHTELEPQIANTFMKIYVTPLLWEIQNRL